MKENNRAVYLLDGYSLIYRSYFAFINRPLINSKGENTSAVFGFFRSIANLFETFKPEYFAVVLDSRVPTFRHEQYPEYKANREKAPDDLHAQIPVIEKVLEAMNLKIVRKDRFEADDIIAYFAGMASAEERPCYIITGDKDLLQLVDDKVRIMKPDKGEYKILGLPEVEEEWGVGPEKIIDYLALTGDQADNVPGVRGIGPKTAVKLLSEFGDLDGVYANLDSQTASVKKKLEESRENAYLSRELVTLKPDCGLELSIESLSASDWKPADGAVLLREYEVTSVADKLSGENGDTAGSAVTGSKADGKKEAAKSPERLYGGDPLFTGISGLAQKHSVFAGKGKYEAITDTAALEKLTRQVRKAGLFAFDCETDSLDSVSAVPIGFSISIEAGSGWYIPLRAADESGEVKDYFADEDVRKVLKPLLEDEGFKVVGQNIKYDYKVLKRWGIQIKGICFDTMIAAWMLDSSLGQFNMDLLAERAIGYQTIHYDDVVPKNEIFDKVTLENAVNYAAEDTDITFRLYKCFEPELKERKMMKLYNDIELPLVTVLAEMELRGIIIDTKLLSDFGVILGEQLETIQNEIYELCGMEFNINSTKQLQEVLFEKRGLKPIKKTKTGYSTNVQVLEILAEQDPVPEKILENRSLSKLKSTYVDTLPALVNGGTGRIHTQFIQTGTATGRLSSKDPNLQNIPVKTDNGRKIREAFIPAEGCRFLSADYSQIELVVLAHLSGDEGLKRAFLEGEDVHKQTAALIFDVFPEFVTADQRRVAKTINFGVMYGMSAFRLSRELKIPRKTADEFIGAYFARYKRIKEYIEKIADEAGSTGIVHTIMGHERFIHGINSRNATERAGAERIALNTPIQGSAADIVKMAMLALDKELEQRKLKSRLLLQVHDELIFEVPEDEIAEMETLVKSVMESVYKLDIPLRVNVETGACWGDMH